MPKHIFRLVSLILGLMVVAVIAKPFLTADSFYRFGHYRANSVPQIAAQEPVLQTPLSCQSCHAARYALWSASKHKINCEICHGAAQGHAKDAKSVKYAIPKDGKLCATCHEAIPGRPPAQRQVQLPQHWGKVQCNACHNSYTPKIVPAVIEAKGDPVAGKARAAAGCIACHGPEGVALVDIFPSLAGQSAPYLARMMAAYKSGERVNPMMSPMAKALSDDDIQNVAAYYAGLACKAGPGAKATGNAAAGKILAANCGTCHGESGTGSKFAWPKLAAQNPGYQVLALKAFKAGQRKEPMMAGIAATLSDADIANLAAYYAAQNCQAAPSDIPAPGVLPPATPGTQASVSSTPLLSKEK